MDLSTKRKSSSPTILIVSVIASRSMSHYRLHGVQELQSGYNMVIAHAKVVYWYREFVKGTGKWSIKLAFSAVFGLPVDSSNPDDVAAAERFNDFDSNTTLILCIEVPIQSPCRTHWV
jgi:beta-glucosidase/6-phospho-beta-glucosidase/beta-galactosidase